MTVRSALSKLQKFGIKAEVIKSEFPIRTLSQASSLTGLDPSLFTKTVLLKGTQGKIMAVILKRTEKIDFEKVKQVLNLKKPPTPLTYIEIKKLTGKLADSLSPLTIPPNTTVIIANNVLQQEYVVIDGGDEFHLIKIRAADLPRLFDDYLTADITK